jgi:hypothetical protein
VRLAAAAALAASALAAACAQSPPPRVESIGPVPVRIGVLDPAAFDAPRDPPATPTERIEQLVDLFFQAGCGGVSLSQPRLPGARYPDLECRLPGRTPETVVVAAYLEPKSERGDWTGPALLPHLYHALGVEERRHSFVFVVFGRRDGRGVHRDVGRLEEAQGDLVRAIVDLERIRTNPSALAFAASDPDLRHDLAAVSVALGRRGESLRLLALKGPQRSRRRGGAPTIALGSLHHVGAPGEPDATGAAEASRREAERSAARTIAVFLGYLDATLRSAEPAS